MPYYNFDPDAIDAIAINDAKRLVPDFGSDAEVIDWNTYIEDGCVPIEGALTPDQLWLDADYDPFFYVGLMAANGVTKPAWMADTAPPPIKPYVPPRPVPIWIGRGSPQAGIFVGVQAPAFVASPNWNQ
jgi:hypothetical protein